jgi:hypothetical protein
MPEASVRCANQGTPCRDELGPRPASQPCWCSCSERYIRRQQAAERASQRLIEERQEHWQSANCRTVTNLATGQDEEHCEDAPLPR